MVQYCQAKEDSTWNLDPNNFDRSMKIYNFIQFFLSSLMYKIQIVKFHWANLLPILS